MKHEKSYQAAKLTKYSESCKNKYYILYFISWQKKKKISSLFIFYYFIFIFQVLHFPIFQFWHTFIYSLFFPCRCSTSIRKIACMCSNEQDCVAN